MAANEDQVGIQGYMKLGVFVGSENFRNFFTILAKTLRAPE